MKIDILTLFPEMFEGFLNTSIIKRAIDDKKVEINLINFRDFSKDPHHKVDDTPYGGGRGMVLAIEPIYDALMSVKDADSKVILLTPDGEVYNEKKAYQFKDFKHLIMVCGHYEGFDDRIRNIVDYEISIGDYVLTGGEIPAMAVCDSIIRLIPGVIEEESHINDSFNPNTNLLDYPTYTKPREFMGMKVPDVLLNGNHKEINEYRLNEQIKKTKRVRPDLLDK